MARSVTLVVNGKVIKASSGDTLVDAALNGRIVIPHDCCTGQCSTCRVRVYDGEVDDQGTRVADTVLACQATVSGDAVIEFDAVPVPTRRAGIVSKIERISPDIMEVVIALSKPMPQLPGQYVSVAFAGFPARDYSPTLQIDGSAGLNDLVFHIRQEETGLVSSQLGKAIRVGSLARVRGPHGHAFYRRGEGRLVLVSTGTGWAPLWMIARAARFTEPRREIVVVVGARKAANLYMKPSLDWLAATGPTTIVMSSTEPAGEGHILTGRTTQHLPVMRRSDTVHVAGAPPMVEAVEFQALASGATCYADPFNASTQGRSFYGSILALLRASPYARRVAH